MADEVRKSSGLFGQSRDELIDLLEELSQQEKS